MRRSGNFSKAHSGWTLWLVVAFAVVCCALAKGPTSERLVSKGAKSIEPLAAMLAAVETTVSAIICCAVAVALRREVIREVEKPNTVDMIGADIRKQASEVLKDAAYVSTSIEKGELASTAKAVDCMLENVVKLKAITDERRRLHECAELQHEILFSAKARGSELSKSRLLLPKDERAKLVAELPKDVRFSMCNVPVNVDYASSEFTTEAARACARYIQVNGRALLQLCSYGHSKSMEICQRLCECDELKYLEQLCLELSLPGRNVGGWRTRKEYAVLKAAKMFESLIPAGGYKALEQDVVLAPSAQTSALAVLLSHLAAEEKERSMAESVGKLLVKDVLRPIRRADKTIDPLYALCIYLCMARDGVFSWRRFSNKGSAKDIFDYRFRANIALDNISATSIKRIAQPAFDALVDMNVNHVLTRVLKSGGRVSSQFDGGLGKWMAGLLGAFVSDSDKVREDCILTRQQLRTKARVSEQDKEKLRKLDFRILVGGRIVRIPCGAVTYAKKSVSEYLGVERALLSRHGLHGNDVKDTMSDGEEMLLQSLDLLSPTAVKALDPKHGFWRAVWVWLIQAHDGLSTDVPAVVTVLELLRSVIECRRGEDGNAFRKACLRVARQKQLLTPENELLIAQIAVDLDVDVAGLESNVDPRVATAKKARNMLLSGKLPTFALKRWYSAVLIAYTLFKNEVMVSIFDDVLMLLASEDETAAAFKGVQKACSKAIVYEMTVLADVHECDGSDILSIVDCDGGCAPHFMARVFHDFIGIFSRITADSMPPASYKRCRLYYNANAEAQESFAAIWERLRESAEPADAKLAKYLKLYNGPIYRQAALFDLTPSFAEKRRALLKNELVGYGAAGTNEERAKFDPAGIYACGSAERAAVEAVVEGTASSEQLLVLARKVMPLVPPFSSSLSVEAMIGILKKLDHTRCAESETSRRLIALMDKLWVQLIVNDENRPEHLSNAEISIIDDCVALANAERGETDRKRRANVGKAEVLLSGRAKLDLVLSIMSLYLAIGVQAAPLSASLVQAGRVFGYMKSDKTFQVLTYREKMKYAALKRDERRTARAAERSESIASLSDRVDRVARRTMRERKAETLIQFLAKVIRNEMTDAERAALFNGKAYDEAYNLARQCLVTASMMRKVWNFVIKYERAAALDSAVLRLEAMDKLPKTLDKFLELRRVDCQTAGLNAKRGWRAEQLILMLVVKWYGLEATQPSLLVDSSEFIGATIDLRVGIYGGVECKLRGKDFFNPTSPALLAQMLTQLFVRAPAVKEPIVWVAAFQVRFEKNVKLFAAYSAEGLETLMTLELLEVMVSFVTMDLERAPAAARAEFARVVEIEHRRTGFAPSTQHFTLEHMRQTYVPKVITFYGLAFEESLRRLNPEGAALPGAAAIVAAGGVAAGLREVLNAGERAAPEPPVAAAAEGVEGAAAILPRSPPRSPPRDSNRGSAIDCGTPCAQRALSSMRTPRRQITTQRKSEHESRVGGEKNHKCTKCGKYFVERGNFNRHVRGCKGGVHKIKCVHASCATKTFDTQTALRQHMLAVHHEGKMLQCRASKNVNGECQRCTEEFYTFYKRTKHEASHISGEDGFEFRCMPSHFQEDHLQRTCGCEKVCSSSKALSKHFSSAHKCVRIHVADEAENGGFKSKKLNPPLDMLISEIAVHAANMFGLGQQHKYVLTFRSDTLRKKHGEVSQDQKLGGVKFGSSPASHETNGFVLSRVAEKSLQQRQSVASDRADAACEDSPSSTVSSRSDESAMTTDIAVGDRPNLASAATTGSSQGQLPRRQGDRGERGESARDALSPSVVLSSPSSPVSSSSGDSALATDIDVLDWVTASDDDKGLWLGRVEKVLHVGSSVQGDDQLLLRHFERVGTYTGLPTYEARERHSVLRYSCESVEAAEVNVLSSKHGHPTRVSTDIL